MQTLQESKGQYVSSPFDSLVDTVAAENKLTIWIDRRLPKDRRIDGEDIARNTSIDSIESLLSHAANQVNGAIAIIDGVVLVVPKEKRDTLEANAWRLSLAKTNLQINKSPKTDFEWPHAAVAENILRDYCSRLSPKMFLSESIEHDQWKRFEFKQTPVSSIGICLLGSFDLHMVESSSNQWVIENDTQAEDVVTWTYRSTELKRLGTDWAQAWRTRWPDAKLTAAGRTGDFSIVASVAAHRDLVRPLMQLRKPEPKKANGSEYRGRLSGDLSGELEIAIRSLSAKTKIEFYPLPLPPQLGSKQIRLVLKNNTFDECLKLLSEASGVSLRRVGEKVEVGLP
jgi:hypothetical protein